MQRAQRAQPKGREEIFENDKAEAPIETSAATRKGGNDQDKDQGRRNRLETTYKKAAKNANPGCAWNQQPQQGADNQTNDNALCKAQTGNFSFAKDMMTRFR